MESATVLRLINNKRRNPYLSFVDKYFPNAVSVVDSFHAVQWIRVFDTPNPQKALAALFFWSNLDSLLFLNS